MSVPQFFTPYGSAGPSTRARVLDWLRWTDIPHEVIQYTTRSNNRPSSVLTHPFRVVREERASRRVTVGPTIFIQKEYSPFSLGDLEASLMKRARRSIWDIDDNVFAHSGLRSVRNRKFAAIARRASTIVVGNEFLQLQVQDLTDSPVVVVPTCVNIADYEAAWNVQMERPPSRSIVWIGSPTTERYVLDIREELATFLDESGHGLIVVSGPSPTQLDDYLGRRMTRIPWSPSNAVEQLAHAAVGIMPLPNTAWTRGKCGYKLLQYAAAGVPFVSSPVGVNRTIASGSGMPTATDGSWSTAIENVLSYSSTRRAKLQVRSRDFIDKCYSFGAWEAVWRRVVLEGR